MLLSRPFSTTSISYSNIFFLPFITLRFASYSLCSPPVIILVYLVLKACLKSVDGFALKGDLLTSLFFSKETWVSKMPPFTTRGFLLKNT